MTGETFNTGRDPVPAEWRRADPERDAEARRIAAEMHTEARWEPEDVYYVTYGDKSYAFVQCAAGAWWFLPPVSRTNPPLDPEAQHGPAVELSVSSKEDALRHGIERVAWALAGEERVR